MERAATTLTIVFFICDLPEVEDCVMDEISGAFLYDNNEGMKNSVFSEKSVLTRRYGVFSSSIVVKMN